MPGCINERIDAINGIPDDLSRCHAGDVASVVPFLSTNKATVRRLIHFGDG